MTETKQEKRKRLAAYNRKYRARKKRIEMGLIVLPIIHPTGKDHPTFKHGCRRKGIENPEYTSWRAAKERVTNPRHQMWRLYGGRGIKMCP